MKFRSKKGIENVRNEDENCEVFSSDIRHEHSVNNTNQSEN